ncbi:MAG: hypothetical protein WC144_03040 [Sulfurimonas sp.]|jgi:hypothetical protein|nr:hypothetical protein [Sulfurimonadaceae bacterium]
MSEKLALSINGKVYDVKAEGEFAKFLSNELKKDFNINGNNDAKILFQSYVRKVYDRFLLEKKIDELSEKVDSYSKDVE